MKKLADLVQSKRYTDSITSAKQNISFPSPELSTTIIKGTVSALSTIDTIISKTPSFYKHIVKHRNIQQQCANPC